MKKILKQSYILLFLIVVAVMLSACGNKTPKAYDALSKAFSGDSYTITVEGKMNLTGNGDETVTMTIAEKAENKYMEVKSSSVNASIIIKDNKTYTVLNDEKMYTVKDGQDASSIDTTGIKLSKDELDKMKTAAYTTGKETIDGKEYSYEKFNTEDGTDETYYFDGKDLKYIKTMDQGEEVLLKIINLSGTVNDSIFNIPDGYQLVG